MKVLSKKIKHFTILILLIFTFACSSDDDSTVNNDIEVIDTNEKYEKKNIAYGEHSRQKFDLYLPTNRTIETTKTLILVHGGTWLGGDKADMNPFIEEIQQTLPNYALASINYRYLSQAEFSFDNMTADIDSVIQYLIENNEKYQITSNFGLLGVSAGGHLSMLYGFNSTYNDKIHVIASVVGPTNFMDPNYLDNEGSVIQNLYSLIELATGNTPENNPDYFKNSSPIHVVDNTAPPTILFYGDNDELVPTSQSIDLKVKLEELNILHEHYIYEGQDHSNWNDENLMDVYGKLTTFIQANL
ncbi:alpha/beta hydrolase [Aureivirga sp. CE67]|uniref:alpha/beta hydrolase n=1 Tax=Aureivirga sp. CE67 TaxID=1788983 RepID=UPI0018CB241A|nr:alpha/beta hydrolase [Aureivirga sp. CE67]